MEYSPVFNITPDILNIVYEVVGVPERLNIISERAISPFLRKENRIKENRKDVAQNVSALINQSIGK